jgi:hypothetical protein
MALQTTFQEFAETNAKTLSLHKLSLIQQQVHVCKYALKVISLKIQQINAFKFVSLDMLIIIVDIVLLNALMILKLMDRQINLDIKYVCMSVYGVNFLTIIQTYVMLNALLSLIFLAIHI